MDLFETIFGSEPEAKTTQQPVLTDLQRSAMDQLISQILSSGKITPEGAYKPYEGQFTAGMSGLQNSSLAALEALAMKQVEGAGTAQKALTGVVESGGNPVDVSKVFDTNVAQPMMYDFTNKILPQLNAHFAGNAAFGSDKKKQTEILTKNFSDSLVNARAKMEFDSMNQANQNLMTAANALPGVNNQAITSIMQALSGGAVPQATAQNELTAKYQDWLRGQTASQANVQALLAAIGLPAFQNITTVTPGTQGLLGAMLSGSGGDIAKLMMK